MAKNIVNLSLDGSNYTTRPYGTCSTAATTTAKVVDCDEFSLTTGATILVKFTYANSASSPTINVNSTGAKSIYYRGKALTSSLYYWGDGDTVEFIYNGTQWDLLNVSNTNTTYSSLKNPNSLKIQGDSTDLFSYDGSAAKTLNIKAGNNVTVTANTSDNSISIAATDTTYTAGNGLTLNSTTLAVGAGTGITVSADTVSTKLRSTTALTNDSSAATETSGRIYPVAVDKSGYLAVNVPWVNPTTYSAEKGITLSSSNKFGHSNTKITAKTTYVDTDADASIEVTSNNGTFKVTDVKYDEYGHITGSQDRTIKITEAYKGTVTSVTISAGDGISVTDGTNATNSEITSTGTRKISVTSAGTTTFGGIKASNVLTSSVNLTSGNGSTASRFYGVQVDKDGIAFVNVPWSDSNTYTSAYCNTAAGTAAKTATCSGYALTSNTYIHVIIVNSNSAASALTLSINSKTAKTININGTDSSSSNYTLPAGSYIAFYDGSKYYFRTDGILPGKIVDSSKVDGKTVTTSISSSSNDTTIPTSGAVYTAIYSGIKANDAMIFKGVINSNSSLPANHKVGDTYRVGTAGTYAGQKCEVGDIIICTTTSTSANNSHWTVIQTNIDGAVIGPEENDNNSGKVAIFDGKTGKIIKSSGFTLGCTVPSGALFTDTTYGVANQNDLGLIKPWYYHTSASTGPTAGADTTAVKVNTITTTANRYYAVEMDVNGRAFVNVPWERYTYTYTLPEATTNALGGIKIAKDNTSYTVATNTSPTISANVTTAGKYYGVEIDSTGKAYVYVPWEKGTNTDITVKQSASTDNNNYYLLASAKTSPTSGTAYESIYSTGISINPSTKTITATTFSGALSGNASSSTYATNARITATTSAGTYYPTWASGTTSGTNYVLRGNSNFRYNIVAGTTSAVGYDSIYLGNSTGSGTEGNSAGRILLYSASTSYHYLVGADVTSAVTHTLPSTGGTILNTGTSSVSANYTSGTQVATIKINNSSTKIFVPSIPDLSITDTDTGTLVSDVTVDKHAITLTRFKTSKGSTSKPVYFNSSGVLSECSDYAGGTAVTLNGTSKSATTASFYAPTSSGTAGQVLVSGGSGKTPTWEDCGGKVKSTTASVTISTSWGTLLSASNLDTLCDSTIGTYAIQVSGSNIGICSGIFTWNSSGSTNDEILLHRTGASKNIYLRLSSKVLQIACNEAITTAFTVTIKVRRLI